MIEPQKRFSTYLQNGLQSYSITPRFCQPLGYLTPNKFLEQWKDRKREKVMCH